MEEISLDDVLHDAVTALRDNGYIALSHGVEVAREALVSQTIKVTVEDDERAAHSLRVIR